MKDKLLIRPVRSQAEIVETFTIEAASYPPDAAADLSSFYSRQQAYGNFFLVAELNGKMAGMVNGVRTHHTNLADERIKSEAPQDKDGAYFCILTLAVHPDHRRKGIGSELMRELIRTTRLHRLSGLLLMCERHLIEFYQALGFRYVKLSASRHGGIEWHEMQLDL